MSAIVNKSGSPKGARLPTLLEHRVMESRQGEPLHGCRFMEIGFQPGCALHQGFWRSLRPTEQLRTSWGLCGAAKGIRHSVTTHMKSIPTAANGGRLLASIQAESLPDAQRPPDNRNDH